MGRSTYGGGFLSALHYDLWFINRATAREIIGYITVVMLFVLLSGILIHKRILKDFFNIKQSVKSYTLVLIFLVLEFSSVILNKGLKIESLLLPLLIFFKAIVFGGIEELGWRYSFQPTLEKKIPHIASTLITFVCWGVWHLLFFYIDGSLGNIHVLGFLLGLLTNSFILSALFAYSNSLWICVMTHALINTFSQMSINDNVLLDCIAKVICIFLAVYLYHVSKKKRTIDK